MKICIYFLLKFIFNCVLTQYKLITWRIEFRINIFELLHVCVYMLVAQSCPALRNPMECSPPGSSVHEILQARILEWVAILFSRGSSQPRDHTQVSCIAGRLFTIWATREVLKYVYYNLNCEFGMLLQRSKCNIDYKVQKLFCIMKIYSRNLFPEAPVSCCAAIRSMEPPSLVLKQLLWLSH